MEKSIERTRHILESEGIYMCNDEIKENIEKHNFVIIIPELKQHVFASTAEVLAKYKEGAQKYITRGIRVYDLPKPLNDEFQ